MIFFDMCDLRDEFTRDKMNKAEGPYYLLYLVDYDMTVMNEKPFTLKEALKELKETYPNLKVTKKKDK